MAVGETPGFVTAVSRSSASYCSLVVNPPGSVTDNVRSRSGSMLIVVVCVGGSVTAIKMRSAPPVGVYLGGGLAGVRTSGDQDAPIPVDRVFRGDVVRR